MTGYESSKAYNCILQASQLVRRKDGPIEFLSIDPDRSDPDVVRVFGGFRLPLPLFEMTKPDIREEFDRMGLASVADLTWFCHTPIDGSACGICAPCKTVMQEGMSFRLSDAAKRRYEIDMRYGKYLWYAWYKRLRGKVRRTTGL